MYPYTAEEPTKQQMEKKKKYTVVENIFGLFEQSISLESVALFFTLNFPAELIQVTMGWNLEEAQITA